MKNELRCNVYWYIFGIKQSKYKFKYKNTIINNYKKKIKMPK